MSEQRIKSKSIPRPRLRREGDNNAGMMARTKYRALVERSGFATARQVAEEDLYGVITFLNDSIGSRETYELVQRYADAVVEAVIEHERRPRLRKRNEGPETV